LPQFPNVLSIKIINKSDNPLPEYQTNSSAGVDLRAFLDEPVQLAPSERALIPTGLFIELPKNYEAQIRPRSGLAYKHGITVLNSPGTIDADYRGEIGILLINHSNEIFTIKSGERIAQMVINKVEQITFVDSSSLSDTVRGTGGYGHTGKE
jgi:dUTP pyrophosphatase